VCPNFLFIGSQGHFCKITLAPFYLYLKIRKTLETQVSNIFLSKLNKRQNKPLCSEPPRIPEKEAMSPRHVGHAYNLTISGVSNGAAEGRIDPPEKLNVKTTGPT